MNQVCTTFTNLAALRLVARAALGVGTAMWLIASAPARAQTDEQLMASGQWRDVQAGLIWMRCSAGQQWSDHACAGVPILMSWEDAVDYPAYVNQNENLGGQHGWRLPSVAELASLRRCSTGWYPAKGDAAGEPPTGQGERSMVRIPDGAQTRELPFGCLAGSQRPTWDTRVFSGGPGFYWSSSSNVLGMRGYAWGVWFSHGIIDGVYGQHPHAVRLVRDGP